MIRRVGGRAAASPLAVVLALASALAAAPAGAANVSIQGGGTASAGYTDNVASVPDEPLPNQAPREGDAIFQLAPRAILSVASPRFIERLAYTFTADLFARHSEANSYSNMLDWTANLVTSSTTMMILDVQSVQGKISTFNINQPSAGATVTVLPQNTNTNYFSQTIGERLEANPRFAWTGWQSLTFVAFVPLDRGRLADSYLLRGEGGFDRVFRNDSVGAFARVEFIDFVQPRDPMTNVPVGFDQRQVLASLAGRWRRDWSRSWSSEASLGAIGVVGTSADPTSSTQTAWAPSALAAIRFSRELGAGELRYAHDVEPSALAGRTFESDSVTAQAGLPIVRAHLLFGVTVGYQHARSLALTSTAGASASAHVAVLDVSIGWQPIPALDVFARYALFDQFGSPPMGDTPAILPDLTRNLVMVGVNVLYPPRASARVANRAGTRVDRADQPAFPDVHAPEPK